MIAQQMGTESVNTRTIEHWSAYLEELHSPEENIFRDDGYSGTTLKRPALDALCATRRASVN